MLPKFTDLYCSVALVDLQSCNIALSWQPKSTKSFYELTFRKTPWPVSIWQKKYFVPKCSDLLCILYLSIQRELNCLVLSDLKTVRKRMFLYKWPLYDLFWPFFHHKYDHLLQNWGSDGHFEVLNRSYLRLVQELWHKTQIFPFLFFVILYKNRHFCLLHFLWFCVFCHNFCTNYYLDSLKHLKMIVWISVLLKINM